VTINKDYAKKMAEIAEHLSPDEVQLNTPLRPCATSPLTPEAITSIKRKFSGLKNVVTVYEAPVVEAVPLNSKETLRRRPKIHS